MLGEADICALTEQLQLLRTEIAQMESADLDIGDFNEAAVPSEVNSLKHNIRRQGQHAAHLKELRKQVAEARATGDTNLSALIEKLAQQENEASKLVDLVEMQKTAPAFRGGPPIWRGPSKTYVSKVAR